MISVQEATQLILACQLNLDTETVPLTEARGRVLAEQIFADRDFPPFDRVTMDGIAISFGQWEGGRRDFQVQEISAAGTPRISLGNDTQCVEVMTGTILPDGCDTVIRYEDMLISEGVAKVKEISIAKGQNIHRRASDRKAGDVLVGTGVRITAAETGIAASVGKQVLQVLRRPRIALVSSGDELVGIEQIPLPHQIRKSNVYQMYDLLAPFAAGISLHHVRDTEHEIAAGLQKCLAENDAVILSGGVSEGKFDFIPSALERAGVRKIFHKVAQRPGKPLWFGAKEGGTVVFALPGNPVSTFLCTLRYILPWVHASERSAHVTEYAVLTEDFTFNPSLTYFLQVRLQSSRDGKMKAVPLTGHGSGDFANLADADGFLELPPDQQLFHKGDAFPFWRFR